MNDQALIKKLNSQDHLDVAYGLTDLLLSEYETLSDYKDIAPDLRDLRDIIWEKRDDFVTKHTPKSGRPSLDKFWESESHRNTAYQAILGRLDTDEKREHFMQAYARMGHLYEMAGLIARDNFFQSLRTSKKPTPHGAEAFVEAEIKAGKSWNDIVTKLEKPTSEYIFTAHPTNTNSLESMRIQRNIALASREIRTGNNTGIGVLKQEISNFILQPLTPQIGNNITNIDVAGETEQMLYYLGNVYDDITAAFRRFDEPLAKAQGYDPLALKLKFQFGSWGSSGDKDGNKKVNAQTTLLSMVMHREAIFRRYVKSLEILHAPELGDWKQNISNALREIEPIKEALQAKQKGGVSLTTEEFDVYSKSFSAITVDVNGIEKALVQSYRGCEELVQKNKILSLIRRVRTFGDTFGHIEYRETAEEFTRIASLLVDGYKDMSEEQRVAKLTEIIQNANASSLLAQKWSDIKAGAFDSNGALKPYDDNDARPIAYHTIKRLELARDHPEMVVNQVLAECENTSNFLEVKLLMEALQTPDGKKPILGIVPLFEKPEVMKRVGDIMAGAYDNPVYKQHMELFKKTHTGEMEVRDGKIVLTQQIQFAHSDNSRRAGMASARANIDEAHDVTFAIGKEHGVETRYYQGGSLTDPYRGGMRSQTATINQYGLHNFFKHTVQGGDLLNFFNYPHSMVRNLTRVISHCAKHYDNTIAGIPHEKTSIAVDFLARKSLQAVYDDYGVMFSSNMLGKVLGESGFGNKLETPAGQVGSRAQRKEGDTTQMADFGNASAPVDPDNIRTINFSELFQHEGITPTWLGVRNLKHKLFEFSAETLSKFSDMRADGKPLSAGEQELERLLKAQTGTISPEAIKKLYELSPVFKDIIDRIAHGVSMTNLDAFEINHPKLSKEYAPKKDGGEGNKDSIMKIMRSDYLTAARLSIAALTGREAYDQPQTGTASQYDHLATWLREQVRSNLTFGHTVSQKSNYMEFVQAFKNNWKTTHTSVDMKLARLCHNALDTVTHGRITMADDPRYAEAYLAKTKKKSVGIS